MPLTGIALRNAKPKEQPYKLFDGGGLFLYVTPSGSRLWRLAYRFAGKTKQFSFGPYPTISLADARQKRDEAKRALADGEDPSVIRQRAKIEAAATAENTFGLIAGEHVNPTARTNAPLDRSWGQRHRVWGRQRIGRS